MQRLRQQLLAVSMAEEASSGVPGEKVRLKEEEAQRLARTRFGFKVEGATPNSQGRFRLLRDADETQQARVARMGLARNPLTIGLERS